MMPKQTKNEKPEDSSPKRLLIASAVAIGLFFLLNGLVADGKPRLDEEAAIEYHYKGTETVSSADYNAIKDYVDKSLTYQSLEVLSAGNGMVTIDYSLYTAETLLGLGDPSHYNPGVLNAHTRYRLLTAMTFIGPFMLWVLIMFMLNGEVTRHSTPSRVRESKKALDK